MTRSQAKPSWFAAGQMAAIRSLSMSKAVTFTEDDPTGVERRGHPQNEQGMRLKKYK